MAGTSPSEVLAGLYIWPLAPRNIPSYALGGLPPGSGTAAARVAAAGALLEGLGVGAGVESARAAESILMGRKLQGRPGGTYLSIIRSPARAVSGPTAKTFHSAQVRILM